MTSRLASFDITCHGRDGEARRGHEWQSPHSPDRRCVHCGTVATVFFDAATRARTAGALKASDDA